MREEDSGIDRRMDRITEMDRLNIQIYRIQDVETNQ